ncbi:hypothetical protein [Metabacillus sp. RGM 3146]|uniref:hypothetical protein n=1 Tax=Metabacillus sp. RGM 3146 TaxID=3401092 RepID=UPI003B9D519A
MLELKFRLLEPLCVAGGSMKFTFDSLKGKFEQSLSHNNTPHPKWAHLLANFLEKSIKTLT